MQRIQEMRKIFENIDYINWKGELFYVNEILEIILWILGRSWKNVYIPRLITKTYIYIYIYKTYSLTHDSKKIVNFYTKLYELV